jgi:hypothetical protein
MGFQQLDVRRRMRVAAGLPQILDQRSVSAVAGIGHVVLTWSVSGSRQSMPEGGLQP